MYRRNIFRLFVDDMINNNNNTTNPNTLFCQLYDIYSNIHVTGEILEAVVVSFQNMDIFQQ